MRAFEEKCKTEEKHEKIRPIQNTPRNPQQPGDRDHLERAGNKTRPTRLPIQARFYRFRVCGNLLRIPHEISKNDERYTCTLTDTQTDGQAGRQTN